MVAQLGEMFPGARVVDRRVRPSHGYRAVHVIVTSESRLVEIQIRTEVQHLWAQMSEKQSDTDPLLKYGGGNAEARALLMEASSVLAELERMEIEASGTDSHATIAAAKTRMIKRVASMMGIARKDDDDAGSDRV
jgi:ppGpp synthetase/RelA/SpoT-type nucleotidyltranferase